MTVLGLIKEHDFYYKMSDDPRKFENGFRREQEICKLLNKDNIEEVLASVEPWQKKFIEDLYVRIND